MLSSSVEGGFATAGVIVRRRRQLEQRESRLNPEFFEAVGETCNRTQLRARRA